MGSTTCCEETQPVKCGLTLFGIIWVCFEGASECGLMQTEEELSVGREGKLKEAAGLG